MSRQRAAKLYDLAAHESPVSSLALGPKSGRVLVTGGEDRRVNLWAIGKTAPILSLAGHTTAVEAVALDWPEELVVAGAANGAIKLWDLDSAKVVRTLLGHKSNTRVVEFHPFGDFFASGSTDLTVKIWDIRRKGCIQTYHGHQGSVEQLKMTPDGRWIATGSADHTVKIWDMTAGKMLHSLNDHTDAITSVSFHPTEFLMSTASADGIVKVSDLQTFECVSTSNPSNETASVIEFTADGQELLAATPSGLKSYTWEPFQEEDHIAVSWPNISDFRILPDEDKVVAVTKDHNLVGVWILDIAKYNPQEQKDDASPMSTEPETLSPVTFAVSGAFDRISLQEPSRSVVEPFAVQPPHQPEPSFKPKTESFVARPISAPVSDSHSSTSAFTTAPSAPSAPTLSSSSSKRKSSPYVPVSDGNRPLNLDVSKFILSTTDRNPLPLSPAESGFAQATTDSDVIDSLLFRHTSLCQIFQNRLSSIRCVREVWDESNIKFAVETLCRSRDSSLWVDILRILNLRPRLLSLDVAVLLLPLLKDLLFEVFEDYIITACDTIRLLSKSFSTLILSSVTVTEFPGVDISREERIQKCKICHSRFVEIQSCLKELEKTPGKVGAATSETLEELGVFS